MGEDNIRRFCSEPSPDVFSVVAQALAFGGSLEKSTDPRSVEAALKAAFSSSEQGTTIPRTQTINMLRELMFRTCERFLNGGYSPLELSVQAVRDQRLMISILAIEQLTGAVTPPVVGIGAAGSTSNGAGADAVVRLDDASKERDSAEEGERSAQAEVDGGKQTCDAIAKAVEDKIDLSADQKTQEETCNKQKTALASAKERSAKAAEHYSDLRKLATEEGGSALTSVSAEKVAEMTRAHAESVEKVGNDVVEIVGKNFNDGSEVMLFCIKALSPEGRKCKEDCDGHGATHDGKEQSNRARRRIDVPPDSTDMEQALLGDVGSSGDLQPSSLESDPKLRTSCISYLVEKVKLEQESLKTQQESLKTQQEKLKAEQAESASQSQLIAADLFDRVWPQMDRTFKDPKAKKRFVEELKSSLPSSEQSRADCFAPAHGREEYRECFMKLEPTQRYDVQHLLTGGK
jgi:hypothetical protein